jgi:hypothetical protein
MFKSHRITSKDWLPQIMSTNASDMHRMEPSAMRIAKALQGALDPCCLTDPTIHVLTRDTFRRGSFDTWNVSVDRQRSLYLGSRASVSSIAFMSASRRRMELEEK